MEKVKRYLHGDKVFEGQYHCRICDVRVTKDHFSQESHNLINHKTYLNNLETFKRAMKNTAHYKKIYLGRTVADYNLFAHLPVKKPGSFYRWLKKQKGRDDVIGDLANDSLRVEDFPIESISPERLKSYLSSKGACYDALTALDEAFDEFRQEKKTRERTFSLKLRFEVFKEDNFKCRICGKSSLDSTLEIDHIIPISKGGSNDRDNLQTLCFECNRGKGIQILDKKLFL